MEFYIIVMNPCPELDVGFTCNAFAHALLTYDIIVMMHGSSRSAHVSTTTVHDYLVMMHSSIILMPDFMIIPQL